jgi:hypothetical protein
MPVDKALLGTRYTCYECGAKFYDMNKPEALCPSCNADQVNDPNPDPIELLKSMKRRSRSKTKAESSVETSVEVKAEDNNESASDEEEIEEEEEEIEEEEEEEES